VNSSIFNTLYFAEFLLIERKRIKDGVSLVSVPFCVGFYEVFGYGPIMYLLIYKLKVLFAAGKDSFGFFFLIFLY